MYLVDTHTHIYLEEFDADRDATIQRALEAGVGEFYLPNIHQESIARLQELCARYPDKCFPMMGLHPTEVRENYAQQLAAIAEELDRQKYIAIGEIGLDLYWDKSLLNEQLIAFETQVRWSLERQLPIAIHSREAFPQVFDVLRKIGANDVRGVFHSFGGSEDELHEALSFPQFYIGINGVLTFKNTRLRNYLHQAPLHRIVLETDAPYLAPVPHRGKRNEPAYLTAVVQELAKVYRLDPEKIARQTTENAHKLFDM